MNKKFSNIENYQKEKYLFYILEKIIKDKNSTIYSDNNSYIIGQTNKDLPIWIWTANLNDLTNLKNDLDKILVNPENKITSKKELYELLKKEYEITDYFEMGYLSLEKPIKPLNKKGIFVRPNYSDVTTLAEYFIANEKEMDNIDIDINNAIEEVNAWVKSKEFYILKDNKGKIVSMAGYSILDNIAKITHVYTPVEERNKGYCKNLIYNLSKKLLEEGYQPVLYTDYNYKPSNKAYKEVGFEDKGLLINYKIKK